MSSPTRAEEDQPPLPTSASPSTGTSGRAAPVWALVRRLGGLSIVTILALTVLVRLAAGVAFSAGSTDTYEFGWLARNVVDGQGYTYFPADGDEVLDLDDAESATRWLPSAYMPPLYTAVAVAGEAVGGPSQSGTVWAVRGVNLVLACGTVLVLRALTARLCRSAAAGNLAALGFALYPPAVYAATQVSAANLYVPVQLAVLLALLVAAGRPSWRTWGAAGALLGVLCLLRAEAVPLLPLAALWLWWTVRRATPRPAGLVGLTTVFVAAALVLPAAWLVRNSATFGEPTLTIATTGGSNLWIGNHPGASGSQKEFDIPAGLQSRVDDLPPTDDYELRLDATFRREAVDNITGDPVATAGRSLKKVALLLGADVYDRRSLNPAYLAAWAALAVVGTLGLVQWLRSGADRPERVLVVAFLAVNVVLPAIFFVLARYKLPIEVMLLVFAGGWLTSARSGGVTTWRRS